MGSNPMDNVRFLSRHYPQAHSASELRDIVKQFIKDEWRTRREILPTFMFDNPPGGFTSTMQVTWADATEKRMVARAVTGMLGTIGATRYAVITENWFAEEKMKDGESIADAQRRFSGTTPPSQRENKRECVVYAVHDERATPLSGMYEIVRPTKGLPFLKDWKGDGLIDMLFGPLATWSTKQ